MNNMIDQLDIFSFIEEKQHTYKIKNKIRLIELFAGIGSQAKALKNIGADFEHYKVVEFDKYAIASYNAIHNTNFTTKDITKTKASDLEIVETDKYCYIMTYSFPCQDLSLVGKQKGMAKGTSTRSGLLWEVERILNECKELPQVLLMENVPQVHSKKNIVDFDKWIEFLQSKGYSNFWQDLNAKDYGTPQSRNRTFMVSILGSYDYIFPKSFELKLRLKDMLEDEVDEKFYLSDKQVESIKTSTYTQNQRRIQDKNICDTLCTRDWKDPKVVVLGNYSPSNHNASRIVDNNGIAPTVMENHGTVTATKIGLRTRKLTPKEYWRLMGFDDEDYEKASKVNSNSQLYKQAGNSIVVNVLEAIFKELI